MNKPAALLVFLRWTAGLAIMVLLLGACKTFEIATQPRLDALPESKPIEMTMGIYYGPEFSAHEGLRIKGDAKYFSKIGSASVQMFNHIYKRAFTRTVPVQSYPGDGTKLEGVDAILETRFEAFNFGLGFDRGGPEQSVVYRFILINARGVPVHTWVVRGKAEGGSATIGEDMTQAGTVFITGLGKEIDAARRHLEANQTDATPQPVGSAALRAQPEYSPQGLSQTDWQGLLDMGYHPFRVVVTNGTERKLGLRSAYMHLQFPDGRIVWAQPGPLVLTSIQDTLSDPAGSGAALGPLALFWAIGAQDRQRNARKGNELSLVNGILRDQEIGPGASGEGFVYFRVPEGYALASAVLDTWGVEPDTGRSVPIRFAMTPRWQGRREPVRIAVFPMEVHGIWGVGSVPEDWVFQSLAAWTQSEVNVEIAFTWYPKGTPGKAFNDEAAVPAMVHPAFVVPRSIVAVREKTLNLGAEVALLVEYFARSKGFKSILVDAQSGRILETVIELPSKDPGAQVVAILRHDFERMREMK